MTETDHSFVPDLSALEPGTPDIVGAVSLGAAIQYMHSIGGYQTIHQHESDLIVYCL